MKKKILILNLALSIITYGKLNTGDTFKLWENIAPGSEKVEITEEVLERSKVPEVRDRAAINIKIPTITAYVPEKPNGVGILVIPGGGYERVVLDKEADELSSWLNGEGITYFVLKYRLPKNNHKNKEIVPLQDAQRAMRIIRNHSKEWGIDNKKIGVMGFSAGGHVASTLANKYEEEVYKKLDAIDEISARPDFQILGYPVITMTDPYAHKGSRKYLLGENPDLNLIEKFSMEKNVHKNTPIAFIMHATDDKSVPVENSLKYYTSLKDYKIPVELHLYQDGGHGYSIRGTIGKSVANWTSVVTNWLKANKIIEKN
ncbi:MAG: alpha/beta hydrolase [Fusobacterium sp.]|mgnify:FL=1|uniref:alpha/beta hydrolase n=1 Tax=Fusobacterium sp. TaxID=68766 RepID=UPI002943A81B|nr:alpha/beta hydrolase [Fusobacterium sp.]MDY3060656.1 alpha/beta hydrolase [Fusobacterium sp.]